MFCPHCGKEIAEGQAFCQHCGAGLTESVSGPLPTAGGRSKTPWEDRENAGFFGGLFTTLNKVLFKPSDFFRTMPVTGGLTDPLLYALIVGMVGLMFSYFWEIVLHDSMQTFMTPEMKAAASYGILHGSGNVFLAVFSPLMLIIVLFVITAGLHLFLLMVKGARGGFEASFRVVSYCISPFLLLIVPFCGNIIALVWTMVITIIGLKEAHEISGGKAFFAVSFPMLLCCGLVILAASVLFMGVFAASFGAFMHLNK
jgi:hypothetical protein